MEHYVVCYETIKQNKELKFIIGDPARGIIHLTSDELLQIWKSRTCLILKPSSNFTVKKEIEQAKINWVKQLVKEDNPLLIIAACIGVVMVILNLTMTIFSQRLIDDILPQKNITKLNIGIILVLVLLLFKEILSIVRQYFLLHQYKKFNVRIIDFFYNHLLHLPKPFFDNRKIGDLTARLQDTSHIQMVITQLVGNVIIDLLVSIVATIFIFIYSWQSGIISLAAIPAFYYLIYVHNKTIQEGQRSIMVNYALSESNYISTLQGIEPIKSHNKISFFSKKNKDVYNTYQNTIFSLGKIQIKLSFLANSFGIFFLLGILFWDSHQVLNNQMKTGELFAILGMCGSLLTSISNLALVTIPINEAKIAFDRMFEFTGIEPERETVGNNITIFESLNVQNLSFRFAGRSLLLKDVSFKINRGEIIALMGENGSGKSTLCQILQKHQLWESGEIIINSNFPLRSVSLKNWRQIVSIVPQHIHIFNGSVLENIAFDDAFSNTQAVLLFLQDYGFTPFIDNLPQSYMTIIGEEGINLSGGQKQIIALARALYNKPQLLILDEATAYMDRQSEQFLLHLLKQIKKDMGVIFITHRLHILKNFCDRIYILENGTIKIHGTHNTLLRTINLYSKYWNDLTGKF